MNNIEFAEKMKDIALNYKTLYVMGCFGAPMTPTNKTRYCSNHQFNKNPERVQMIQAASTDTFGFDCVCLIKGVLWGWSGNKSHVYGGAKYNSNDVPDINADSMILQCSDLSTNFSKIEVGEAVWMKGHIGVYIGDGLAVECTPAWENKVQITSCNCFKKGYNQRNWTKHGKLPYITYVSDATIDTNAVKIGDVVTFMGSGHYPSTNSVNMSKCYPGKATVTSIYKGGKHPYHLVRVKGGTSNVYGWVDANTIWELSNSLDINDKVEVGDIVIFNGTTHYTTANGNKGVACKGGRARVTKVYLPDKSKHPYHLVGVGDGCNVYGWVDKGTFVKE